MNNFREMQDTTNHTNIQVVAGREEKELRKHKNDPKYDGRKLHELEESQQVPNKTYAKTATFTQQNKNAKDKDKFL